MIVSIVTLYVLRHLKRVFYIFAKAYAILSGLSCRRGKFDKSFVGLLSVGKVYDLEYNVRILESVTLLKFLFDDDSKWFMNNKKQHSDIRKLNAQYKVAMQYLICMLKA